MSKIIKFLLLAIVNCTPCVLYAQQITISVNDYDSLRNEIKSLQGLIEKLETDTVSKNAQIEQMQKGVADYQEKVSSLNTKIANLQSSVSRLRKDSANLVQEREKVRSLQLHADENAAKLANGRLYFRYDNKLIQSSIQILQSLKTESVKQTFSQALRLLQEYQIFSDELKSTLTLAQEDSDRKARNKGEEYKAKIMNDIKNTSYYREVYAKKSSGSWSIPYLDNIIVVMKKCLQHHDPGHGNYVDFTVLIEML